jgi:teichuronic acid biosynthesis glycosyltransferase TuaC
MINSLKTLTPPEESRRRSPCFPMKISVLTAAYPTSEEPDRGRPIWATLGRFPGKVEFEVNCTLPRAPAWVRRRIRPKSYLRYPGPVDTSANPAVPARPLEYFSVPGVTRQINGRLLARAFERRLRENRPDVVLAYQIYPDGYAAVAAAKRLGIPVVIGSRGSDLKKMPAKGLVRRDTIHAVKNADAVLCVSEDLVRIAQSLGGKRVHLIRNGIDRSVFSPVPQEEARRQAGVPPEQRLIVFVGHLLPVKGIPTLLRAQALLKQAGKTWHTVLIGEGVLEGELRLLAEQLGIAGEVRFLGQQSPREIAVWLNACDLFCLPSESEGLPNVVIEALACGRNVVATEVGGTPELLSQESGILVPRGDPAAMAEAMERSTARAWDRDRISRSMSLSWDDVAIRTIQVCRAAAGNG